MLSLSKVVLPETGSLTAAIMTPSDNDAAERWWKALGRSIGIYPSRNTLPDRDDSSALVNIDLSDSGDFLLRPTHDVSDLLIVEICLHH